MSRVWSLVQRIQTGEERGRKDGVDMTVNAMIKYLQKLEKDGYGKHHVALQDDFSDLFWEVSGVCSQSSFEGEIRKYIPAFRMGEL